MDFGGALRFLKAGEKVQRSGWNGKGMYLYLAQSLNLDTSQYFQPKLAPCIVMFTAQGTHQPGWLASQPDMLAEDWVVAHVQPWEVAVTDG